MFKQEIDEFANSYLNDRDRTAIRRVWPPEAHRVSRLGRVQCALDCRKLSEERKTVCSSEILQQKTLIKTHHMISTKAIPGVYNSPYHR